MSADWDVYCLDCEEGAGIENASCMAVEMMALCRKAAALAELMDLAEDIDGFELKIAPYASVPVSWFLVHAKHRLVPRDEYGRCLDDCGESIRCDCCGSLGRRCRLPMGHEGPHSANRP